LLTVFRLREVKTTVWRSPAARRAIQMARPTRAQPVVRDGTYCEVKMCFGLMLSIEGALPTRPQDGRSSH
jgi:hypothetical protein